MRALGGVCFVFLQVGCSENADDAQTDCRILAQQCSAGFTCEYNAAGEYECLQDTEATDETANDPAEMLPPASDTQTQSDMELADTEPNPNSDTQTEPELDGTQPVNTDDNETMDTPQMVGDTDDASGSENTEVLGDTTACSQIGIVGPVLPAEAGHRVATVLTPSVYPYEVGSIRYELLTPEDTSSCTSALAHTTELVVIANSDALPPTPGEQMLRFRSYTVPADEGADDGRAVELTLPSPLYLAEGEQLVVSVELAASQDRHLCISRCLDYDANPGTDWWSNAAQPPYNWSDLIVDYGFKGALRIIAYPANTNAN